MIAAGWSPSVRLFEAAACATPVISDSWDGLDSLFEPGREIILADSADQVVEQLSSDEDTARSDTAARGRVLREHTAAHRARSSTVTFRKPARAKRGRGIEGAISEGSGQPARACHRRRRASSARTSSTGCSARAPRSSASTISRPAASTISPISRTQQRFEFVEHDVDRPLPQWLRGGRTKFTHIYHLACAASPPHYQADPEHTMLTNVVGTQQPAAPRRGDRRAAAADLDQRGLRRSRGAPAARGLSRIGQAAPARAPATTRASAPPRRWRSISCGRGARTFASRASSTLTGRACAAMTAASFRTSSARRCRETTSPSMATARRPAVSATSTTSSTAWCG